MLPALEYCCQTYKLSKLCNDVYLENHWSTELNFWERLHKLKLYSLQRRRERYMIIIIYCIWKITQHRVPNWSSSSSSSNTSGSSSKTDRWVHFHQNAGLRLFVHTWIVHGIDDCYHAVYSNRNQKASKTWNIVYVLLSNKQKSCTIPTRKGNNCVCASERLRKC